MHIASQMGHVGAVGRPAYCAAKGALIQLAKAMALDHAPDNVRVNSLSPGAIETRRMLLRHGDLETARAYNVPKHALGRIGQPVEIARAALFLVSDASSFMTGRTCWWMAATRRCDGGPDGPSRRRRGPIRSRRASRAARAALVTTRSRRPPPGVGPRPRRSGPCAGRHR